MIWNEIILPQNPSYFEGNEKMFDRYHSVCENTSQSVLQKFCSITTKYGSSCKFSQIYMSHTQFCNFVLLTKTKPSTNDDNVLFTVNSQKNYIFGILKTEFYALSKCIVFKFLSLKCSVQEGFLLKPCKKSYPSGQFC